MIVARHTIHSYKRKFANKFKNSVLVQKLSFFNNRNMKNVYRAYELDNQPTNLSNKFVIRNCSFGALELTKNEVKRKLIYSDYGMTFDESSS